MTLSTAQYQACSLYPGGWLCHLLEGYSVDVNLVSLAFRARVGDHECDGVRLPVWVALARKLWAIIDALHLEAHPATCTCNLLEQACWLDHLMIL